MRLGVKSLLEDQNKCINMSSFVNHPKSCPTCTATTLGGKSFRSDGRKGASVYVMSYIIWAKPLVANVRWERNRHERHADIITGIHVYFSKVCQSRIYTFSSKKSSIDMTLPDDQIITIENVQFQTSLNLYFRFCS